MSREDDLRAEFERLWLLHGDRADVAKLDAWTWFLIGANAERDARLPANFGVAPEATGAVRVVDRDDPNSIAAAIRAAVDGK